MSKAQVLAWHPLGDETEVSLDQESPTVVPTYPSEGASSVSSSTS